MYYQMLSEAFWGPKILNCVIRLVQTVRKFTSTMHGSYKIHKEKLVFEHENFELALLIT